MAQTGLARAIYPVHTPLDGDVVFAAATGRKPLADPLLGLAELGTHGRQYGGARGGARGLRGARRCLSRGRHASWRDRFAYQITK